MTLPRPRIPTWFIEQIPVVLVLVLEAHTLGGFDISIGALAIADVWLSAMASLAGWKIRSIANRQREQNQLAGVTDHRISCWKAAERYAALGQILLVIRSLMKAASPWSLVYAAMVLGYGEARRVYRCWKPARLEARDIRDDMEALSIRVMKKVLDALVSSGAPFNMSPAERVEWLAARANKLAGDVLLLEKEREDLSCVLDVAGMCTDIPLVQRVQLLADLRREDEEQAEESARQIAGMLADKRVLLSKLDVHELDCESIRLTLDRAGIPADLSIRDRVAGLAIELDGFEAELEHVDTERRRLWRAIRDVVGDVEVTEEDRVEATREYPHVVDEEELEQAEEKTARLRGLRQLASRANRVIPVDVLEIAQHIATQDNRITQTPLFAVQQRVRDFGLSASYTDDFAWISTDGETADGEESAKLEAEYQVEHNTPIGWSRVGVRDRWEFVTACFTEHGCNEFLRQNGHNLTNPRIYVYGGYRNVEWATLRNHMLRLAVHDGDGTQTAERIKRARLNAADKLAQVARHITRDGDGDKPHTDAEKAWCTLLAHIQEKRKLFMPSPFLSAWREMEDLQIAFNEAWSAETARLGAAVDEYDGATKGA